PSCPPGRTAPTSRCASDREPGRPSAPAGSRAVPRRSEERSRCTPSTVPRYGHAALRIDEIVRDPLLVERRGAALGGEDATAAAHRPTVLRDHLAAGHGESDPAGAGVHQGEVGVGAGAEGALAVQAEEARGGEARLVRELRPGQRAELD